MVWSTASKLPTIILLIVLLPIADGRKINGNVDVVFLLPSPANRSESYQLKQIWRKRLLDHIEMGEKARISIIVQDWNETARVLVNLTNNPKPVKDALDGWIPVETVKPNYPAAFDATRLFEFNESDRARIIIGYLSSFTNGWNTQEIARMQRQKNVFVYIIFGAEDPQLLIQAQSISGSSTRTFGVPLADMFSEKCFDKITNITSVMTIDLCSFCRFDDTRQSSCTAHPRQPGMKPDYFGDNNTKCREIQPNLNCTKSECEEECDRQWPWDGIPKCTTTECGMIKRKLIMPAPSKMENCPSEVQGQPFPQPAQAKSPEKEVEISETGEMSRMTDTEIGTIVGTVLGIIVFILISFLVVFLCARKRQNPEGEETQKKIESVYIELDDDPSAVSKQEEDGKKGDEPPKMAQGSMKGGPKKASQTATPKKIDGKKALPKSTILVTSKSITKVSLKASGKKASIPSGAKAAPKSAKKTAAQPKRALKKKK